MQQRRRLARARRCGGSAAEPAPLPRASGRRPDCARSREASHEPPPHHSKWPPQTASRASADVAPNRMAAAHRSLPSHTIAARRCCQFMPPAADQWFESDGRRSGPTVEARTRKDGKRERRGERRATQRALWKEEGNVNEWSNDALRRCCHRTRPPLPITRRTTSLGPPPIRPSTEVFGMGGTRPSAWACTSTGEERQPL